MDILFAVKVREEQQAYLRKQFPNCTFHFDGTTDSDALKNAEVIVTFGGDVTSDVLHRAEKLKWIMVASAGIEKMDLEEIAKRNLLVTNVRGIHKTPMAESVIAHILALKRSIHDIGTIQSTKEWRYPFKSTELKDSTALILGPGAIGMEIGRLLQAFGVKTIGCNRSGKQANYMDAMIPFNNLVEELPKADIVISVLPSTEETKGLLTRAHFEAMKESALFLNFGRGDLVDEELLIDVLRNEEIGHAILDVFQTEPLQEESPFWSLPNCTVSPHISSKSGKYMDRALIIFEENLQKYIKGARDFTNIVDVQRGY